MNRHVMRSKYCDMAILGSSNLSFIRRLWIHSSPRNDEDGALPFAHAYTANECLPMARRTSREKIHLLVDVRGL